MDDSISDILKQAKSPEKNDEIEKLTGEINRLSQSITSRDKVKGAVKESTNRLKSSFVPTAGAFASAAASASPAFAAIQSLWDFKKDFSDRANSEAGNQQQKQLEKLQKRLESLQGGEERESGVEPNKESESASRESIDYQRQQVELLTELVDVWYDGQNETAKAIREQNENTKRMNDRLIRQKAENQLMSTENEGSSLMSGPDADFPEVTKGKEGGFDFPALGIGTLFPSLVGLFSGMSKLVAPLGKATKLLKVGPLALITSVFEFGKGFLNANEILDKESTTIPEKVQAGVMSLIGSFGGLFDMVAGWLGFDTNTKDFLMEKVRELTQAPVDFMNGYIDFVKKIWSGALDGISTDTPLADIPGKLLDNITGMAKDAIDNLISKWKDFSFEDTAIGEKVSGLKEGISGIYSGIIDGLLARIDNLLGYLPDFATEGLREKIKELRDDTKDKESGMEVDPSKSKPRAAVETAKQNQRSEMEKERKEKTGGDTTLNSQVTNQNNQTTSIYQRGLSTRDNREVDYGYPRRSLDF